MEAETTSKPQEANISASCAKSQKETSQFYSLKKQIFMKKNIYVFAIALLAGLTANAQSGQKWSTGLNSLSTGDGLGSSNSMPLNFYVNNAQKMSLGTTGVLQLNSLKGTGSTLLQADLNGNLLNFPMGNASQVLFGNGTWGALPANLSPWSISGSNIYYTSGNTTVAGLTANSLNVIGNSTLQGNVTVTGNKIVNGSFSVAGNSTVTGLTATTLTVTGNSYLDGNVIVNGNKQIKGSFNVVGGSTFSGPITAVAFNANSVNANTAYFTNLGGGAGTLNSLSASGAVIAGSLNVASLAGSSGGGFVTVDSTGNFKINPFNPGGGGISIDLACNAGPAWVLGGNTIGNVIANAHIGTCDYHPFPMVTNNIERMRITELGKVGIGTNSPSGLVHILTTAATISDPSPFIISSTTQYTGVDSKLFEVTYNGQAYAREIFVKVTTFPDYVFKKDYKLMPLGDLEKYISINQHLPNIPSAKEVEKSGQNVGEIQVKQMEKIEELTLYIIQLQKQVDELKNQVKDIRK